MHLASWSLTLESSCVNETSIMIHSYDDSLRHVLWLRSWPAANDELVAAGEMK
jgi:hypothetical protein